MWWCHAVFVSLRKYIDCSFKYLAQKVLHDVLTDAVVWLRLRNVSTTALWIGSLEIPFRNHAVARVQHPLRPRGARHQL